MKQFKWFFNAEHILKSISHINPREERMFYLRTLACTDLRYKAVYINLAKIEDEAFEQGRSVIELICKVLSHEIMHQAIHDATKGEVYASMPYGEYTASNKFDNIAYDEFEEEYL